MTTPLRNVRVPTDLWQAAQAAAEVKGETVTAVINRALTDYSGFIPADAEGRRQYGYCAKCGQPKPLHRNYVGACCSGENASGPPYGYFFFCAVGGCAFDAETRCYVCDFHLAVQPSA